MASGPCFSRMSLSRAETKLIASSQLASRHVPSSRRIFGEVMRSRGARVLVGEPTFDARVPEVRRTVGRRIDRDDGVASNVYVERAPDSAVGARGRHRAVERLFRTERGFVERAGRAGLDAGAARDARAVGEPGVHAGDDARPPAAPRVGEREGPLHLVARANAPPADDALVHVHFDVRVPVVLRVRVPLADVAAPRETEVPRDLAQLVTVAVARERLSRVIGEDELDDPFGDARRRLVAGVDDHSLAHRCRACGDGPARPLHSDEADAARAERRELGVVAEGRDGDLLAPGHVEDGGALARDDVAPVDGEVNDFSLVRLVRPVAPLIAPPPSSRPGSAASATRSESGWRRRARTATRASSSRRARRAGSRPASTSARGRGVFIRFAISSPRRPPIRHGKHLPHDSASQNSKRWTAMSRASTRSSQATTPP